MRVPIVVSTVPIGDGLCDACKQYGPRIMLGAEFKDQYLGKNVCVSCLRSPGITMTAAFETSDPKVAAANMARKKKSIREEKITARDIEGRGTRASGATFQDGDAINDDWMVEEKRWAAATNLGQVTAALIEKTLSQAGRQGKAAVLRIRLPKIGRDLAIMLWSDAVEALR